MRRPSRRSWRALWLVALSVAAGCGGSPRPTPTATPTAAAKDCLGAAALVNGCPEPDGIDIGAVTIPKAAAFKAGCKRTEPLGLVEPCVFGSGDEAFAVVGDSHARQLRATFEDLARALGRRGYQLARNSCPFVRDGRALPEPTFSECARFKRQVPKWLARHPEVKTVFVIGLPRNAASQDPANWTAAWETLPASVERLVVIRDTPEMAPETQDCVVHAASLPGSTCAVPRTAALAPDPAVAAAEHVGAPVIDLTRYFCDETRCFPVVGGVLAFVDATHVQPSFPRTISPFLIDEVRRLPS